MMSVRPEKRSILFSVKLNQSEAEMLQAVADSLQRTRGDTIRQLVQAAAGVLATGQQPGVAE